MGKVVFGELNLENIGLLTVCMCSSDFTLQKDGEGLSSASLTDTLSLSSSLSSDTSDAGCQMIQPVMDSTRARNVILLLTYFKQLKKHCN